MEEWCALKRDPDIQVSNQGRVRFRTKYILPQRIGKCGYKYVNGVKGYGRYTMVHRLVLHAFSIQPHPKYFIVDHKNGNRSDNRRTNLRWVTPSLNNLNRLNVKGWWKDKKTGKYFSRVTVEGNKIDLGCFDTMDQASYEYSEAKRRAVEIFDDYNLE